MNASISVGRSTRARSEEGVGVFRQEGLAVEIIRRELHATGIDRLAPGPRIRLLGQAFVVLGRVRQGKDDEPFVEAGHRLDDLARDQSIHTRHSL
jgi:hypothetical protein